MSYKFKEIYYTLQGEGAQAGRAAIFCRFTGCNLWSGREEDRDQAICKFCDTDFFGMDGVYGGKYSVKQFIAVIQKLWPQGSSEPPYLVFTGGEPALQLDQSLLNELHRSGMIAAIETNGTLDLPDGLDWICVSPKANTVLNIVSGDELKLVFPQEQAEPTLYESLNFDHFYLQPMDGVDVKYNTDQAIQYCKAHPKWKLSVQTHKFLQIP